MPKTTKLTGNASVKKTQSDRKIEKDIAASKAAEIRMDEIAAEEAQEAAMKVAKKEERRRFVAEKMDEWHAAIEEATLKAEKEKAEKAGMEVKIITEATEEGKIRVGIPRTTEEALEALSRTAEKVEDSFLEQEAEKSTDDYVQRLNSMSVTEVMQEMEKRMTADMATDDTKPSEETIEATENIDTEEKGDSEMKKDTVEIGDKVTTATDEKVTTTTISIDELKRSLIEEMERIVGESMAKMNVRLDAIKNSINEISDSINKAGSESVMAMLQQQMGELDKMEHDAKIEIEEVKKEAAVTPHKQESGLFMGSGAMDSWNGIKTT